MIPSLLKFPSFHLLSHNNLPSTSRVPLFKTYMKEWQGRKPRVFPPAVPSSSLCMAGSLRSLCLWMMVANPSHLLPSHFLRPHSVLLSSFVYLIILSLTLVCKLHEGRNLSYSLLLSTVPRIVPNTK